MCFKIPNCYPEITMTCLRFIAVLRVTWPVKPEYRVCWQNASAFDIGGCQMLSLHQPCAGKIPWFPKARFCRPCSGWVADTGSQETEIDGKATTHIFLSTTPAGNRPECIYSARGWSCTARREATLHRGESVADGRGFVSEIRALRGVTGSRFITFPRARGLSELNLLFYTMWVSARHATPFLAPIGAISVALLKQLSNWGAKLGPPKSIDTRNWCQFWAPLLTLWGHCMMCDIFLWCYFKDMNPACKGETWEAHVRR